MIFLEANPATCLPVGWSVPSFFVLLFFSKAKKELPLVAFFTKKKYNNPTKGFPLLSGLERELNET
jgi:hypothetical protein